MFLSPSADGTALISSADIGRDHFDDLVQNFGVHC